MNSTDESSRSNDLLIIRGLCAMGVVMHHVTGQAWLFQRHLDMKGPIDATRVGPLITATFWPPTAENFVLIFFVLSGYLMGKVFTLGRYRLSRAGIVDFYRKRLLRVAPLLWFNILVLIALTGSWNTALYRVPAFLGDVLFVNNLTGVAINPVTWSISYEMQDYLLCPLFFWAFSRSRGRGPFPIALALVSFGCFSYVGHLHPNALGFQLFVFSWLFLSGFLANYVVTSLQLVVTRRTGILLRILGFLCFIEATVSHWAFFKAGYPFLAQIALAVFSVLMIVSLELRVARDESSFAPISVALTWLGRISYGVYLWHFSILYSVVGSANFEALVNGTSLMGAPKWVVANVLLVAIVVGLTLALSTVTFFLVELRFRPNLYSRRPRSERSYVTNLAGSLG